MTNKQKESLLVKASFAISTAIHKGAIDDNGLWERASRMVGDLNRAANALKRASSSKGARA